MAEYVVDARVGPELLLVPHRVVVSEELREHHGIARPVDGDVGDQVADVQDTHRAARYTGGQLTLWEPVGAEHALADGALLRHRHLRCRRHRHAFGREGVGPVEVARLVRAGSHAGSGPDAGVHVHQDEPLIGADRRADRADVHARGVLAHHAGSRHVEGPARGVRHAEHLDPGLLFTEPVALLTGLGTHLATVAVAQVDDHAPGVRGHLRTLRNLRHRCRLCRR